MMSKNKRNKINRSNRSKKLESYESNIIPWVFKDLPNGSSRPVTYDDMSGKYYVLDKYLRRFEKSNSNANAKKVLSVINRKLKSVYPNSDDKVILSILKKIVKFAKN